MRTTKRKAFIFKLLNLEVTENKWQGQAYSKLRRIRAAMANVIPPPQKSEGVEGGECGRENGWEGKKRGEGEEAHREIPQACAFLDLQSVSGGLG